jgi:4-hydroxy-4-methyl-2-oxoglutarate aldolase
MILTPIAQRIIDTIKLNRISTTKVADALGKNGVIPGVLPIIPDIDCVGPVRPVFTAYNIIGDLIAKFITLYQRASAVVVNGLVRDAAQLRRQRYAVWSAGVTPLGCYNAQGEPFPADLEAQIRFKTRAGLLIVTMVESLSPQRKR